MDWWHVVSKCSLNSEKELKKKKKSNFKLVCIGETTAFLQECYSFKVIGIVGDLLSFK